MTTCFITLYHWREGLSVQNEFPRYENKLCEMQIILKLDYFLNYPENGPGGGGGGGGGGGVHLGI